MRPEVERLHFLLGHFDSALVRSAIQPSFDGQPRLGRSPGNKIDDGTVVRQGPTSPVGGDEREEAMLDLVPFAGAWRKMTRRDRQVLLRRKALQLPVVRNYFDTGCNWSR